MMPLSRREFLAGAAGAAGAALALEGCGGSVPSGSRAVSVVLSGTPVLQWAPVLVAKRGGLFAAQHLDVEILNAESGTLTLQQVVAGNATVGRLTSILPVRAIANEHAPLVIIGTDFQESPQIVISLGQRPVRSLRDLAGKTIGLSNLLSGTAQVLDVQLQRLGIPTSAVRRVVTGESAASYGFLEDHRVDAVVVSLDNLALLRQKDPHLVSFNLTGLGPVFGVSYVVTRETLAKRRRDLIRFMRAIRQASEEVINPSTQAAALQKMSGSGVAIIGKPALAHRAMDQIAQAWFAAGRSNLLRSVPSLWSADVRLLVAAKYLHPGADAASMYTNAVLDSGG